MKSIRARRPARGRDEPVVRRETDLAPVWRALADPTRRAMLDLLRERPRTTGELAAHFPASRFAAMKHLAVLVDAGLVVVRREGRERWNHLNAVPIRLLHERWVRPYEACWADGLLRFRDLIERREGETTMATSATSAAGAADTAGILRVELEVRIEAPRERVWRALVDDIRHWWHPDFYALPGSSTFTLEATPGGRMYEERSDGGGALWGTVVAVEPGVALDIMMTVAARFGGPRMGMLRLDLREDGDATILAVSDSVMGRLGDGSREALEGGWRVLVEGLREWVEGR